MANVFIFNVKLANAQKTKSLIGKKMDKVDSKRLTSLLRGGLIEACYVPERKIPVLREWTRLRTKMVTM
ncbi:MAG: hypothetical protein ACUVQM_06740 [Candidatus Hadarchaeaceae archaeon]